MVSERWLLPRKDHLDGAPKRWRTAALKVLLLLRATDGHSRRSILSSCDLQSEFYPFQNGVHVSPLFTFKEFYCLEILIVSCFTIEHKSLDNLFQLVFHN